ncbi:MAG TPA: CpaD family pilus assembly lipoprotein [Sphingomicrobium sp.]|nr:CpaD family pilus assembly lipoprotein [Sphingomicrobium sp.]
MRKIAILIALGSTLTACNTTVGESGLSSVHQPVVASTQFVFDAAAPGGSLPSEEAARLDGWFSGLGLEFGDKIYVAGDASPMARSQVAQVVGRYGLLIANGSPVTNGAPETGVVRVVVDRKRAFVPGCPDWSKPSQPNYDNANLSNFGCGVNANLAMQVANPEDLLHGSPYAAAQDAQTAAKAIIMYRNWNLTATRPGQKERPLKTVDNVTQDDK